MCVAEWSNVGDAPENMVSHVCIICLGKLVSHPQIMIFEGWYWKSSHNPISKLYSLPPSISLTLTFTQDETEYTARQFCIMGWKFKQTNPFIKPIWQELQVKNINLLVLVEVTGEKPWLTFASSYYTTFWRKHYINLVKYLDHTTLSQMGES